MRYKRSNVRTAGAQRIQSVGGATAIHKPVRKRRTSLRTEVALTLTAQDFAEAYSKGFGLTVRFIQSRVRGIAPNEAEEIAQDAWARGWEYRDRLKDRTALNIWINSIALNIFRSGYRRDWRRQELIYEPAILPHSIEQLEVSEALDACSVKDSRLLQNYYMHGYSTAEIARSAGVTSIAIRVRLARARNRLRETMA